MKVKFKDVPLGGRIIICSSVWVVLQQYGSGLVARESLTPGNIQSLCCFTNESDDYTLETEVEYIGLDVYTK